MATTPNLGLTLINKDEIAKSTILNNNYNLIDSKLKDVGGGTKFYQGTFTNLNNVKTAVPDWSSSWLYNNKTSFPRNIIVNFPTPVAYVYIMIPNLETFYSATSSTAAFGDSISSMEIWISPEKCVALSHGALAYKLSGSTFGGLSSPEQPTYDDIVYSTEYTSVADSVPGVAVSRYTIGSFNSPNVDLHFPTVRPVNYILGTWDLNGCFALGWN